MDFPDTIEGFGYQWSEDGKLQQKESGKPFQFEVKKNNHAYNQSHYEALGEVITSSVYELLEKRCGLQRYPIPVDATTNEPQTFIFCTENFQKTDKLLVLIHGSGVVRAGQWARRLIINDSLDSGTQIPFILRGIKEGYGVLVMNTNDNGTRTTTIRGSENATNHAKYVWKNYIKKCSAQKIAIVAHSYGGVVTISLFKNYQREFCKRVFAVAMTDSVHFVSINIKKLIKISQNWVTSGESLDTAVSRACKKTKDVPCVSAGCLQHEMTSWSSFESIFQFFEKRLHEESGSLKTSPDTSTSETAFTTFGHSISSDEEEMDVQEARDAMIEEKDPNGMAEVELGGMVDAGNVANIGGIKEGAEVASVTENVSRGDSSKRVEESGSTNIERFFKKLKCDKSL